MALHFAAGGSASEVTTAGFNLVDVQTVEQLNELPEGSKGLIWLNEGEGVTQSFIDKVTPFIGNPKLYGFFLVDEPDPTGRYHTRVDAADLRAESDYIHSHVPGAKTFITLMDMGSAANPDFSNTYNYANTHIDLFGVDPYPVRTGTSTVDYDMIDRSVAAAVASGIPTSQIVPVYQTFGGGGWTTNTGGKYVMPTTDQLQTMMDHWEKLVPNPAFDFAYAWGEQEGDTALEHSPALQAFFREHNLSSTDTAAASSADTSDSSSTVAAASSRITSDSSSVAATSSHVDTSSSKTTAATSSHVDTSDASSTATATPHARASHDSHATGGGEGFRAFASTDRMGGDHGGNYNYHGDRASGAWGSSVDRTLTALRESFSDDRGSGHTNTSRADRTAVNLASDSFSDTAHSKVSAASDSLGGYRGGDAFVFKTNFGTDQAERNVDFSKHQDKINLDHAALAGSKLAGPSHAFSAHDNSDHVTYDRSTGSLSFDGEGSGGTYQFATHFPWQHHSL